MTVDNRGGLATYSLDVNPNKIRLIEDFLTAGTCIDLGCGSGAYGEVIASRCDELLQVDLADRRSPEASHFPFLAMDARDVVSLGRTFDNVVALDLLEHVADEDAFLSALARICGRRLILSVPNDDDTQPAQLGLTHFHHTD